MRKLIVLMFCSLFSLTLLTGCGCEKKKDNLKLPNTTDDPTINENVNKDTQGDGFDITNVVLVQEETQKEFKATITNKTEAAKYVSFLVVTFKNENNEDMKTIRILVDNTLQPNGSYNAQALLSSDVMNAKSVVYSLEY